MRNVNNSNALRPQSKGLPQQALQGAKKIAQLSTLLGGLALSTVACDQLNASSGIEYQETNPISFNTSTLPEGHTVKFTIHGSDEHEIFSNQSGNRIYSFENTSFIYVTADFGTDIITRKIINLDTVKVIYFTFENGAYYIKADRTTPVPAPSTQPSTAPSTSPSTAPTPAPTATPVITGGGITPTTIKTPEAGQCGEYSRAAWTPETDTPVHIQLPISGKKQYFNGYSLYTSNGKIYILVPGADTYCEYPSDKVRTKTHDGRTMDISTGLGATVVANNATSLLIQ